MRIFLDANILFSYARSDGAVRRLVEMLLGGDHECWIDRFVLAEARRNVAAKSPSAIPRLEALLPRLRVGQRQVAPDEQAELPVAEKDRPVLGAAIHYRCEALVTGDRTHFGALYGDAVRGVTVYSPRSLAEEVLEQASRESRPVTD